VRESLPLSPPPLADPSGERKHLTAALEAIVRIGVADVCDRLIGFLEPTPLPSPRQLPNSSANLRSELESETAPNSRIVDLGSAMPKGRIAGVGPSKILVVHSI